MKLTDIMNSINYKKNDLSGEEDFEKNYVPYVVNKCVANCKDTVFYAETISRYANIIPIEYQYKYYLYSLRPKRRFGKWFKKPKEDKIIKAIQEYYEVSERIAKEYKTLLTPEQIDIILEYTFKGE